MKLYISETTDLGLKSVTAEHNGQYLLWEARLLYGKLSSVAGNSVATDGTDDGVFREINAYWSTLSAEKQDAIWREYTVIYELFQGDYDQRAIISKLQMAVARLYQQMSYEDAFAWAEGNALIKIPQELKTQYDPGEVHDTTYLRRDYFELTVLAILIRPMVPIWAEYVPRIKDDVKNTHKEYGGLKLIFRSWLTQCPPYLRLLSFMQAWLERPGKNSQKQSMIFSAMLDGLAEEEISVWLLANVLVRRTSTVSINKTGTSSGGGIISDIYNYVKVTLNGSGSRRFAGQISEKTPSDRKDDGGKESVAESYKLKEQQSAGDLTMVDEAVKDSLNMMLRIDPTADPHKLNLCIEASEALQGIDLNDFQLGLIQWVFAPAVSTDQIPIMPRPSLLPLAMAAQALLWHWGYPDLAGLLTARELMVASDEFVSSGEARIKIPNELIERMAPIYPHPYQPKGKNDSLRATLPGVDSVETMFAIISGSDWMLTCHKQLAGLVSSRLQGSRKMYLPGNIRVQLGELLIHLYHVRLAFYERSPLKNHPLS